MLPRRPHPSARYVKLLTLCCFVLLGAFLLVFSASKFYNFEGAVLEPTTSVKSSSLPVVGKQKPSLARDGDDADAICPVTMNIDNSCARVVSFSRTTKSGLGHQLSEMLFAMHVSYTHRAALKFGGFSEQQSRHGMDYAFATDLFGLRTFMKHADYDTSNLREVSMQNTSNVDCGVVIWGNYKECPGGHCFLSPYNNLLFHKYSRCLRAQAKKFGTWKNLNPHGSPEKFQIAWHVRLGDIELHPVGDMFYKNLYNSLLPVLANYADIEIRFIGEWSLLPKDARDKYEAFLFGIVGAADFVDLHLKTALLYMLHSDLLIGSGSTLPMIAALFSTRVLYINVKPKTGWNFLNDFLSDGLVTSDDGVVLNHVFEINEELAKRRQSVGAG